MTKLSAFLATQRAMAARATAGPWVQITVEEQTYAVTGYPDGNAPENYNDAEFIASARNNYSLLLSIIERQQGALQKIVTSLEWEPPFAPNDTGASRANYTQSKVWEVTRKAQEALAETEALLPDAEEKE